MPEVERVNPYGDGRRKAEQVQAMFDAIAPAYDFMNRAMTLGLDRLWLRRLLNVVAAAKPAHVVDLATGTGDVAFAMARRMHDCRITGIDLSPGMLAKAQARLDATTPKPSIIFRQGDSLATGLPDMSTDAVTVAYGVRNFADIAAGYREMLRILRPGGLLAVLELSRPVNVVIKPFYALYTRAVIPAVGRIVSGDSRAYTYLPESIAAAPQGAEMLGIMKDAGFEGATFKILMPGVCTLYTAYRPL